MLFLVYTHLKGMRYLNPHQKKNLRKWIDILLWQLGYYNDPKAPSSLPQNFEFPNAKEEADPSLPTVTWVNHSTFWIQGFGKSILVDPIWSKRCSPLSFLGPKRRHAAHPPLEAIRSLDAVIISHNHYDHLDRETVAALHKKHPHTLWIVPLGVKAWFSKRFPPARVIELAWWEQFEEDFLLFTALPAQHFSGRGLLDQNRTLWMGCMIEFSRKKRVYFVGDTGYNSIDFKMIKEKFPHIDLSLIPIGVYKPRKFMRPVHVDPSEAVQIHLDVGSHLSIGGHWGTFRLSSEEMERPPFDLHQALGARNLPPQTFRVLSPGQTVNW